MNPLLKKEIRLILPAWGLTLLLAVVPILIHDRPAMAEDVINNFTPVWFGVLILCAASFGREFSLGTFSWLLAQPFPRKQFWLTKVGVLAVSLVSVVLVYASLNYPITFKSIGWHGTALLVVFMLSAIAGGLWMALLIRQIIAIVWLIVLVPFLLSMPLILLLDHFNAADRTVEIAFDALLLVYSVAGIAGSWLIFQRAQDAPWSGSTINLPDWMSASIMQRTSADERHQVPWRALIRKEFQFNQVPLLGMGVLFLIHLGVVGLRYLHRNPEPADLFWRNMNSTLQAICFLWVVAPLIFGCTSIAEERKLGTMEGQLCQPVSSRRQFLVKFGFVVIMGGLLSTALLYLAEGIGLAIGAAPYHQTSGSELLVFDGPGLISSIAASFLAIAIIGLFASSLARNLLQALPIAIGMIVGIGVTFSVFDQLSGFRSYSQQPGFILWNPLLPGIILGVLLTITLPWLTYRNFRSLHESARIWRRNGLCLATVLVFSMAAGALIFHRAWEMLTPLEPAHGPAFFLANQPVKSVRTTMEDNFQFSLPDGRVWFACLVDPNEAPTARRGFTATCRRLLNSWAPPRMVVGKFFPDDNWASLAAGYVDAWVDTNNTAHNDTDPALYQHIVRGRETVGVRTDGTLWVSEKPDPTGWNATPLVQYGTETNWQSVVDQWAVTSVILLKKDGTLWRWGGPTNYAYNWPATWPGLRAYSPRQIGTNASWQSLMRLDGTVAQKTDGTIWSLRFNDKTRQEEILLNTNFDLAGFNRLRLADTPLAAWDYNELLAGIHADGTLWLGGHLYWDQLRSKSPEALQCSQETNWVAVALGWRMMVALKSDGTLWRWGGQISTYQIEPAERYAGAPVRLGIHQDWIALAEVRDGIISLAADGSLWLWPDDGYLGDQGFLGSGGTLIEPSDKPVRLGNVLASN